MTHATPLGVPETDWSDPSCTDTRAKGPHTTRPLSDAAGVSVPLAARASRSPASGRPARDARVPGAAAHPRAGRAPRVPFAVLVLSLIVGGMALLLVLNTASAANELDRRGLATQDAGVAAQVEQLRNEVAASAAPANLARAAEDLGMVPAANPAFLVISADGSVVLRGSAAPVAPDAVPVPPAAAKPAKSAKPTPTKPRKTAPAKSTKSTPAKPRKSVPKPGQAGKHTSAPTRSSSTKHASGGGNR